MSNLLISKIQGHPVFADLKKSELAALADIVDQVHYDEGVVVFETSQTPNFIFYIESGSFTLQHSNNQFKKLLPGQLMGEIGVINGDFRTGSVTAAEPSSVIRICGTRLFKEEFIPSGIALKIVRSLSKQITNYLKTKQQTSTKELIKNGENGFVEFKSSIRWNLYTRKKDKAMELAVIKTLAAFMNTEGGMLLIGVRDDGEILGLDEDQFENKDKMFLHLTGLLKSRIGALALKFINMSIEIIQGKEILRIDCLPATRPSFVKDGNNEFFYIRTGPSTSKLSLSKAVEYIAERF